MDCNNPSLVTLFGMTARHLENYVACAIRPLGLGPEQAGILYMVSFRDMTISEIVLKSMKDKTTISRCIYSLEKKGLIKKYRNITDRRITYVSITEAGHTKLKEVITSSKKIELIFNQCLDSNEQQTLKNLLEKILGEIV